MSKTSYVSAKDTTSKKRLILKTLNFPLFFCYLVACYFNTFSHYHLSNHAFGDYVTMSVANAR